MDDDAILKVRDLAVQYRASEGVVRAVDGVSLDLADGRTLGLIGESGCGKSATAHALLRLISPPGKIVRGQILLRGAQRDDRSSVDVLRLKEGSRQLRDIRGGQISMVFQEPMTSLGPMHTIGNQMVEAIRLHRADLDRRQARTHAMDMLGKVGLPQPARQLDSYPHQLSGGMRQRVMIAMALSCEPRILIADEPTTALDVTVQAQILDLLRALRAEMGLSVIFITHDLGVISEIADEVAVMYMGKIVETGLVDDVFQRPSHPYTKALLESIPKIDGPLGDRRLRTIVGSVPDPMATIPGCAFTERCAAVMPNVCDRSVPELIHVGPGHTSRCFLYSGSDDEVAVKHGES